MKTVVTVAFLFSVALLGSAPAAAQQSCEDFRTLAEGAVPSTVGDRSVMDQLLNPPIAKPQLPDFLADPTNMRRALKLLGSRGLRADPSDCRFAGKLRKGAVGQDPGQEIDCTLRSRRANEAARLDLARGKVTYLNSDRNHDGAAGIENTTSDQDAVARTMQAALAWGVPGEEIRPPGNGLLVRHLMASSVPLVDERPITEQAKTHTAEIHVITGRHVGGVPVFGSLLKTAIDVNGQVARTHIRWPRFCLVPGLQQNLDETLMSREEVIQKVVETLGAQNKCGTLSKLRANIMYVRTSQESEAEVNDSRDESNTTRGDDDRGVAGEDPADGGEPCYMPALTLHAFPNEPEPDSGQIGMGAPEYVVPLIRADPTRG
ncbi:MAG TPA: hypothetical protein VEC57_02475 [Candidatus Limnocylindrales bacterium]|nr:hypothetical protein [Candidatus Limnocylindrales bacterium]